jgi:hypothetical protein
MIRPEITTEKIFRARLKGENSRGLGYKPDRTAGGPVGLGQEGHPDKRERGIRKNKSWLGGC